jgi:YVTN family beta-propeller protein
MFGTTSLAPLFASLFTLIVSTGLAVGASAADGSATALLAPEIADGLAPEPGNRNALPRGRIAVADRGSGTITVIDIQTDARSTVTMPPGARTPEPMYVVYSPVRNRVFVGDRANNRVVVFRAQDFSVETTVPAGAGVFHMWSANPWKQLWVVNDVDKAVTVIDTWSLAVIATIAMPADLVALGGRPHDVILDPVAAEAWVTMLGFPGSEDYVIKYDTASFREQGRQKVGKDPHLSLTWRNRFLFVPCQGSNRVYVLSRRTLGVRSVIEVPGAHGAGMPVAGGRFYTTNFASNGTDGLFAIDTRTHRIVGSAHTPFPAPHNVALTPDGRKLYVTHSGLNNHVSVFEVGANTATPRLLRTITVGLNPFGLDFVP